MAAAEKPAVGREDCVEPEPPVHPIAVPEGRTHAATAPDAVKRRRGRGADAGEHELRAEIVTADKTPSGMGAPAR
jgi:hypothetical protein